MDPQTTPVLRKRKEFDTPKRARFFGAFDNKNDPRSIREICKDPQIGIHESTGRKWLKLRDLIESPAFRRTRKLSKRLGRPYTINPEELQPFLSPTHPYHDSSYETIVRDFDIPIQPRTLQAEFKACYNAKRYKKLNTKGISKKNKGLRVRYGWEHKGKKIIKFWRRVYFTDEGHFNSKELSNKTEYELRIPGVTPSTIQERDQNPLDITLHVAAGISYNHKGVFLFYNDPAEPDIPKASKPRPPKQSKYETSEQFQQRLTKWHEEHTHPIDPDKDIPPKGNSMTQRFYAKEVLPHHIKHIKWLENKYKERFYLQEDNDDSHGTRSTENVCVKLKRDAKLLLLTHPADSPDLNPQEGVWNIIKQRLRGGRWNTVQEFKDAIYAEWKKIKRSEIRKRIAEMPWRCEQLTKNGGTRIRSKLW